MTVALVVYDDEPALREAGKASTDRPIGNVASGLLYDRSRQFSKMHRLAVGGGYSAAEAQQHERIAAVLEELIELP